MHESGGLSPFRGHSSALNASVQFTRAGAFAKRDVRESGLSRLPRRRRERALRRVSHCRCLAQEGADCRGQSPDAGDKKFQRCFVAPNYLTTGSFVLANRTSYGPRTFARGSAQVKRQSLEKPRVQLGDGSQVWVHRHVGCTPRDPRVSR
jgi:hypothetical protein